MKIYLLAHKRAPIKTTVDTVFLLKDCPPNREVWQVCEPSSGKKGPLIQCCWVCTTPEHKPSGGVFDNIEQTYEFTLCPNNPMLQAICPKETLAKILDNICTGLVTAALLAAAKTGKTLITSIERELAESTVALQSSALKKESSRSPSLCGCSELQMQIKWKKQGTEKTLCKVSTPESKRGEYTHAFLKNCKR